MIRLENNNKKKIDKKVKAKSEENCRSIFAECQRQRYFREEL